MPVIYNPTDANFLTVAQSRTNNGQRDVRVILDVTTNIFYTLDDEGILTEIQSSGGGEDLAQTLANGNITDGNDIIMTSGDRIVADTDVTLFATDGDTQATISVISNGFSVYNNFLVDEPSTGDVTNFDQYPQYFGFDVENNRKLTIDGRTTTIKNESIQFNYPLSGTEYIVNNLVGGELSTFTTSDDTPTKLTDFTPRQVVTRVKIKITGYDYQNYLGYYNEITAAFKLDSFGDYQVIDSPNEIGFSDFTNAQTYLTPNGQDIEIYVVGEVGKDIGWVAEIEYSDY